MARKPVETYRCAAKRNYSIVSDTKQYFMILFVWTGQKLDCLKTSCLIYVWLGTFQWIYYLRLSKISPSSMANVTFNIMMDLRKRAFSKRAQQQNHQLNQQTQQPQRTGKQESTALSSSLPVQQAEAKPYGFPWVYYHYFIKTILHNSQQWRRKQSLLQLP